MDASQNQGSTIITLPGTEGNDVVSYSALDDTLYYYAQDYHTFLWVLFFGTLLFILMRYVRPALKTAAPYYIPDYASLSSTRRERFAGLYKKIFHIHEIQDDFALRLFGGAILLGFLATYRSWEGDTSSAVSALHDSTLLCWPFFQSCADWVFMTARPFGYAQNALYMALFGLIFLAAYGLIAGRYILAHSAILILFAFKIYATLLNYSYNNNYDYYHTVFCLVFLFAAHKRFFASVSIVFLYLLSTATKIHESWTLGSYFTSMQTGLPLFPDSTTVFWTNLVIYMEMVGTWFLLSKNRYLQRGAVFFFTCFHLYSGLLVGYHYPTIVAPSLLIFFGPLFRPFDVIPVDARSLKGWALLFALFCLQMISHVIPGDEKLTMEGNFYGLYMFEANHQCIVNVRDAGGRDVMKYSSSVARNRCDPYDYMFRSQRMLCQGKESPPRYQFSIAHSINGGPFYRIVNEPDLCSLTYKPFGRNEWIKTDETSPPVGLPRKNLYY